MTTVNIRSLKTLSVLCAICLPMSFVSTPQAYGTAQDDAVQTVTSDETMVFGSEEEAYFILSLFEAIPESVLEEGDEATQEWIESRLSMQPRVSAWRCSLAIGELLITTAVPVGKIKNIRKLIEQLGGVRATVRLFREHGFNRENLQSLGGTVSALVKELSGITRVYDNCFK